MTKAEQLEMASHKQEIDYSNTRLIHNPFDDAQSKETISGMVKAQVSTTRWELERKMNDSH